MRRALILVVLLVATTAIALLIPSREPPSSEIADTQRRLADGVWRAVVLGDSVARGAGDESGVGIAGYLAAEIRGHTAEPSVPINLGLNGARAANVAAMLERREARSTVATADL